MSSSRRLLVSDATHVGRVRTHNEDCHTAGKRFFAVADGIGGSPHGEVASSTVIAAALEALAKTNRAASPVAAMKAAFKGAHEKMRKMHTAYAGMGTTLTAIAFDDSMRSLVIGHTGDSRAYVFRNRALTQITKDESITTRRRSYLVGAITTDDQTPPKFYEFKSEIGDVFVLCTDGVTNELDDAKLAQLLCGSRFTVGAKRLVDEAVATGGRDNATAIVIRVAAQSTRKVSQ